jgi:N-acetylneuraminic acid mutarotase
MRSLFSLLIICALSFGICENTFAEEKLDWSELPELPPSSGMTHHLGVAGPFAGISEDALIIA